MNWHPDNPVSLAYSRLCKWQIAGISNTLAPAGRLNQTSQLPRPSGLRLQTLCHAPRHLPSHFAHSLGLASAFYQCRLLFTLRASWRLWGMPLNTHRPSPHLPRPFVSGAGGLKRGGRVGGVAVIFSWDLRAMRRVICFSFLFFACVALLSAFLIYHVYLLSVWAWPLACSTSTESFFPFFFFSSCESLLLLVFICYHCLSVCCSCSFSLLNAAKDSLLAPLLFSRFFRSVDWFFF